MVSLKVTSRYWLGLQSSEGLICFQACTHGWQVGAGCWLQASAVLHVSLSMDCLSVLTTWLAFPRAGDPREHGRSCNAFYNLVSEVPCCHIPDTVVVTRVSPIQYGKSLLKNMNSRM